MGPNDPVCFVDCETTGLDPDRHEIWEVGLILPNGDENLWQLPVDLGGADPMALAIGRFYERRSSPPDLNAPWGGEIRQTTLSFFAEAFVRATRDLHLVGACVGFDADRLWRLLRAQHQCPMWHYHLIDVEVLAAGYLRGRAKGIAAAALSVPQANQLADAGGGRVPDIGDFEGALRLGNEAHPPWKSEDLSRAVGVNPDDFERHSALGDARWAKAIYEAVMP